MKKYYKQILAVIIIIGVIVCIKSCADRKEPDITVAYIGYDFADRDLFEKNIASVTQGCEDITGDGSFTVDLMEISFNKALNEADKSNAQSKLTRAIGLGSARLYFIDKEYVEKNKDAGVFADISDLGEGILNNLGETVAISLTGNEKLSAIGIENGENMYLAIRIVSEMDTVSDKKINEKNSAAWNIAKNILAN